MNDYPNPNLVMVLTEPQSEPQTEVEKAAVEFGLPDPRNFPAADVVIFDGHCSFCLGQVKRLAAWDGGSRLAFVSLHDDWVAEQFPDLSHDELMKQIYVVSRQSGKRHAGAGALRYLSRRLPKLWWLAPLMHIPFTLPIWQAIYNAVAKRRYRISEATETCEGSCQVHVGGDRAE